MKFQQVMILAAVVLTIAAFGAVQGNGESDVCKSSPDEPTCYRCCTENSYINYRLNFFNQCICTDLYVRRDHWFNGNYYRNADEAEALQKPFKVMDAKLKADRLELLDKRMSFQNSEHLMQIWDRKVKKNDLEYKEQHLKDVEEKIKSLKDAAEKAHQNQKQSA